MTAVELLERATVKAPLAAVKEAERIMQSAEREPDISIQLSVNGAAAKQIGEELQKVITDALRIISKGETPKIIAEPADLTTTVAAKRIGVSRPVLMKLIREGEIKSHKVGSHHRISGAEADAFRSKMLQQRAAEQRAAFERLRNLESKLVL